jgi:hypothetical protein
MTTQLLDRALIVTPSSLALAAIGSGTLDGGASATASGTLQVLSWTEAPDGRTLPRNTETIAGAALAGCDPALSAALSPYSFGLQSYDPFLSLAASLDRAAEQGASLSLAVWAAMEADLFRFAFDRGFTVALDEAGGTDDWLRFARLNDLYRACVKAIAPLGIVPPAWNSWLRDDGRSRFPPRGPGRILERVLTRGVGSIADATGR